MPEIAGDELGDATTVRQPAPTDTMSGIEPEMAQLFRCLDNTRTHPFNRNYEKYFAIAKYRRHRTGGNMSRIRTFITAGCWATLVCLAIPGASVQAFELRSPDMKPGEPMPSRYIFNGMGCKGENMSPALDWTAAPEGTKSFALMVHDPDANTGGAGIWHWVVVNIPATVTSLASGASTADGAKMPPGSRQIANDYMGLTGSPAWGGPCPPKGQKAHTYNFTIYALKVEKLELSPMATASQAGFFVNLNAIDKATLPITYGRQD